MAAALHSCRNRSSTIEHLCFGLSLLSCRITNSRTRRCSLAGNVASFFARSRRLSFSSHEIRALLALRCVYLIAIFSRLSYGVQTLTLEGCSPSVFN